MSSTKNYSWYLNEVTTMVTIQFIPYSEIEYLSSLGRIKKLLSLAKGNKIILLQGRLTKEEELELIKTTMEEINSEFHGVELATINPKSRETDPIFKKFKNSIVNSLLGNRTGFTVVGPSKIVQQIKNDPSKIELLTRNSEEEKKAKKKKKTKKGNKNKKSKNK